MEQDEQFEKRSHSGFMVVGILIAVLLGIYLKITVIDDRVKSNQMKLGINRIVNQSELNKYTDRYEVSGQGNATITFVGGRNFPYQNDSLIKEYTKNLYDQVSNYLYDHLIRKDEGNFEVLTQEKIVIMTRKGRYIYSRSGLKTPFVDYTNDNSNYHYNTEAADSSGDRYKAAGAASGKDWVSMSESQKTVLVKGVLDTWAASGSAINAGTNWFINALDSYYSSKVESGCNVAKAMSIVAAAGGVFK